MPDEKELSVRLIPPKEFLPYIFSIVAVVLIAFLGILSFNEFKKSAYIGQSIDYQKNLSISGTGKVFAKPDIGKVNLFVITESKKVSTAVSENNQKMNKIIQGLKDLGLEEKDIKTATYNITPRYSYKEGITSIQDYEVNQSVEVKIRELDKTSSILEKAVELGANQVGSLEFTFDDPEKIKEEARTKAIEDAKQKAGTLASTLGIKLGKVIGFDESYDSGLIPSFYRADGIGGGGGGGAPQIQVGQNEVVVNVSLLYELK